MTSENNSETAIYKPIYALDKLDPRLGEKQLYPQTFQSILGYSQLDLTKYKPQKVAQYTFARK